ncbi:MAG: alanine:cation symporter family protein, partial [Pseudomonadota bacterium]
MATTDFFQAQTPSLPERIDGVVAPFSNFVNSIIFFPITIAGVSVPVVVIWLLSAGVILTLALGFINLRGFGHGAALISGKRDGRDGPGEISHFEALSSALSGTVGLGNIASVPVAVALGGPGAVLWMIFAGFFGMTSKFAECSLAVKYRKISRDGAVSGGPMYYIEDVFTRRIGKGFGKFAAAFFAVMCMGASVSLFQVNQSHAQLTNVTGVSAPLVYGVIISGLVLVVILGGIRTIGRVTRVLVPLMGMIYLGAGLTILIMNAG